MIFRRFLFSVNEEGLRDARLDHGCRDERVISQRPVALERRKAVAARAQLERASYSARGSGKL